MDIVRTIWIVNFFFFVLILIFAWSKIYLITRRIDAILMMIKKCDALPETIPVEPAPSEGPPQ
jgi:hypothetical protein